MAAGVVLNTAVATARVGDLLPDTLLGRARARRIDATALVIPGQGGLADYLRSLADAAPRLAAWDGRVVASDADRGPTHRLLVVDRYGQVYRVYASEDEAGLPGVDELEEWFRFLATACPECGVIDDPVGRGWVP